MGDRRPLKSRDKRWARGLASRLAGRRVSPNRISQASIAAAALACLAFVAAGHAAPGWSALWLILGAVGCQLRLLCNLLDGMVAVEGGLGSPDGPFWNEAPDRLADILILIGFGYGLGLPVLGWAAACFAVLTAQIRELGRSCGLPADFSGPMAKPHRMAMVTAGAVLGAVEALATGGQWLPQAALWIVALGAAFTALRRSWRIVTSLRAGAAG